MKRAHLLAGLLMCVTAALHGQSPEQMFQQGNQLYQQGRVAEALETYESILRNGYAGGELYYNLGNAYYKTGNIAKAILNYERALKIMPEDDDLRHNLQLANLMITDKIEPAPRLFVWDYWEGVKNAFSLQGITWITYLVFVMTIGSFAVVILARSYAVRKAGILSGVGTALLFAVLLVIFIVKVSDYRRSDEAVVTAGITTIKNSPDTKSSDAFVLHSGVKVQITDRVSEWIKIRLADGKVGWLESTAAENI